MYTRKLWAGLLLGMMATTVQAAEFKVGDAVEKNGMKLQVLYIQAVQMSMEPEEMVGSADEEQPGKASGMAGMDHSQMQGKADMKPKAESDMASMDHSQMQGMDHSAMGHGDHGGPADIHLEAAIHATDNNPWGFPEGAWVPYLNVRYTVVKSGSYFKARGRLIPMASNAGPHYGANIQLDGPGRYHVTYKISAPDGTEFPYHMDKETGLDPFWPTFEIKESFTYLGVGKKGGY